MDLNWHARAARYYEQLAGKTRDPGRAARWWAEAATAWELAGEDQRADHCRLQDAQGRGAPLLSLQEANLPRLALGQPDTVEVRVANRTAVLARDVVLAYQGHVQQAGERSLGSLGLHGERLEAIEVVPTESGSATLRVTARYADPAGHPQPPAYLELRLKVAQPPEVHHHYHGPHVSGDGVIIMRGGLGVEGRSLRVQSGEDAVEVGRTGGPVCSQCGRPLEPSARYCHECGKELILETEPCP